MFKKQPSGISLDVMGTLIKPKESVGAVYARYARDFYHQSDAPEEKVLSFSPPQLDQQFRAAFKAHYRVPILASRHSSFQPSSPSSSSSKSTDRQLDEEAVNFVWCSIIADTFQLDQWPTPTRKSSGDDTSPAQHPQADFVIGLYDYFSTAKAYEVFPGVVEQLTTWRRRFGPELPIVAVTNTDFRIEPALEDLGLVGRPGGVDSSSTRLLTAVYTSTETRAAKPDPAPLLYAMEKSYPELTNTTRTQEHPTAGPEALRLKTEVTSHWTHIGDEVADSQAAAAAGCHFAPAHLFFDLE